LQGNRPGVARKAKGDVEGALLDYFEAIRLKPDDALAFDNRGLVRKAKGDLERAEGLRRGRPPEIQT
jgi:Flp pilus assembly protein TadD